jgi:transcriptional regulator with XRE-family HTH domain
MQEHSIITKLRKAIATEAKEAKPVKGKKRNRKRSQAEIARQAGLTPVHLNRWLCGKRTNLNSADFVSLIKVMRFKIAAPKLAT